MKENGTERENRGERGAEIEEREERQLVQGMLAKSLRPRVTNGRISFVVSSYSNRTEPLLQRLLDGRSSIHSAER